MSNQRSVILFAALASAGCMYDHMDGERAEVGQGIAAMRAESQTHDDLCGKASTRADVMSELGRHEQRMGEVVGQMNGTMAGMSSCGSGMTWWWPWSSWDRVPLFESCRRP